MSEKAVAEDAVGSTSAPGPAESAQPERPDAFVSYSRADARLVQELVAALVRRGKEVWVDWEDIRKSADWRATIYAGIEAATVVVPVLSPAFAASDVCRDEIEHTIAQNKRLIPIVARDLGKIGLRDELTAPSWIFFRDADDFDASLDELVAALETDHDWLDAHARLLVRAREWERSGRDASFLLRGSDLEAAENWSSQQSGHQEAATALQGEYIVASRRAATRRLRVTLAVSLVAVAVALALAVFAWTQRNSAVENAAQARSRELAAIALAQLRVDPTLAILLAREAAEVRPTGQAEQALRSALARYRITLTLRGEHGIVNAATFSADGGFAVTAGDDGAVRVWDARSGELLRTFDGHSGALGAVALALDSSRVAAATERKVIVWRLRSGRIERVLAGPSARGITGLAFAPSGGRLAATGSAGVAIWTMPGWQLARRLPAKGDPISATFSPGGKLIATAGDRGIIQLWDVDGRLLRKVQGSHGSMSDVAFAQDGRTFAAADAFRSTVHVWSTRTGKSVASRRGPSGFVVAVHMRGGAPVVATVGEGSIYVWDGRSGRVFDTLSTKATVLNGAFSPDGAKLVAGDEAGVAKISFLQLPPTMLSPPTSMGIVHIAFDGSGRRLVGIGDMGDAGIWQLASGRKLVRVRWPEHQIYATAISHDGRFLATGATDGTIRIWTMSGGRPLTLLRGHTDAVEAVSWSGDDRRIASAADDGTAGLWDVATTRRLRTFRVAPEGAGDATVSPDGRRVAATGVESSIGVWDAETGRKIATITNPEKAASTVWSPNGKMLAAVGGFDQAIHVYAVPGAREVSLLRDVGLISYAVFSADGTRLETLGNDGVVRVWDVRTGVSSVVARVPRSQEAVMAISPDGRALASANWDTIAVVRCAVCGGLNELIQLASDSVPRALTATEKALYLKSD